jgi:hypothetical protein
MVGAFFLCRLVLNSVMENAAETKTSVASLPRPWLHASTD